MLSIIADTLIRLTGFGNAAGLLAMCVSWIVCPIFDDAHLLYYRRGLYGMGGVKDRDTASEFRQMQKEQGVVRNRTFTSFKPFPAYFSSLVSR